MNAGLAIHPMGALVGAWRIVLGRVFQFQWQEDDHDEARKHWQTQPMRALGDRVI